MRALMLVSVLVTGTLILVGMVAVLGHGTVLHRRARREARIIEPIRFRILDALGDPFDPAVAGATLRELRRRERERLIVELAPAIHGESRHRLARAAELAGVVTNADAAARSRRSSRRLLGARLLTVLGADAPAMRALLADRVPPVRAQAAEWATDHPRPEVIDRLIDLLSDRVPLARFSAHDALVRIGQPTVAPLLARTSTLSARGRSEALSIARALPDPGFRAIALRALSEPEPTLRASACGLLAALALPDTEPALVARLHDDDVLVRAAAARALPHVSAKAAALHLPLLLRDPGFDVRRSAAHALRSMGPVGTLLLRRVGEGDDRFAAEMARQTLALPEELLRR